MGHDGEVVGDERPDPGDRVPASVIEQLPFILTVCEGPDLRLVAFSAATAAVLPGREILGRPIREVISDLSGQQVTDAYYQVQRTGEPISGREWRVHLSRPDGSVHELWANFTITAWRDPDGTIRGVIGTGFDVTESVRTRLAAEQQAAELRERYEETRDVVTALQQELLPAGLPVLPGVQIAASYLPAEAGTAAGGDFFDAVPRADGTVALVVGDVVGHGVTASGVMGQLRAVLRDRLDSGADVAEAVAAADRFARKLPAAHATTVCVVVLQPADGTLTYCTAGHPPPLAVTADGGTRWLPGTGGAPLGTTGTLPIRHAVLAENDLLLLYSDGIVERPGRTLPAGSAELARVAADAAAGRALHDPGATPADRVCGQVVELLVRATGHTDDITLLAAQRVARPADLDLTLPADPSSLRPSRTAIAGWLTGLGVTERDLFALQHALGELMTNAIEHAFDTAPRPPAPVVRLHLDLDPVGTLVARIIDQGRWREPARQSHRGRGLALTSQLVQSMRVQPSESGTVATIRYPLSRPARTLSAPASPARPATGRFAVREVTGTPGRLRVEGPVDAQTAGRLQHELLQRGRGGTLPLTVDLSAVTHLASAGVSVLHVVARNHRQQGGALTLHAAAGSPAQHVLNLVGLPEGASVTS